MNKTERNYGIDALRIISMMMIVLLHIVNTDALQNCFIRYSLGYEIISLIKAATFCAVNCYALISGFVGLNARHRYSNIVLLWIRVVLYLAIFSCVFKFIFPESFGIKKIIMSFFPIMTNQYWYFTSYFILFLFVPLLNNAVQHISKRQMSVLMVILFTFTSILYPIWHTLTQEDVFLLNDGYSPLWLIVMYLLGAYINRFGLFNNVKKHWLILICSLSIMLTWVSKLIINYCTEQFMGKAQYATMWQSYTSITVVITAISLVILFKRIRMSRLTKKVVSFLTPMTFSVYLIHNNDLIQEYVFDNVSKEISLQPLLILILCIFGFAVVVYILCSMIDMLRIKIFKLLKIDYLIHKIDHKIDI